MTSTLKAPEPPVSPAPGYVLRAPQLGEHERPPTGGADVLGERASRPRLRKVSHLPSERARRPLSSEALASEKPVPVPGRFLIKPPPAKGLQSLPGGRGIVVDDLVANLYALGVNWLIFSAVM